MISKLSNTIARKLVSISGKETTIDQLEVYIYGLECFLDTSITILPLLLWGIVSHSLKLILIWIFSFSLLRHFAGGAHAPTHFSCMLSSFTLGFLASFSTAFIKPTTWSYIIVFFICLFFSPVNKKIELSIKKKYTYKFISLTLISIGIILFYGLDDRSINSTILYSFYCISILLLLGKLDSSISNK